MASIVEGFNYDIFISYRQKDNKHDGWVTGFVDNLKRELESTFKEEIGVYFDTDPHDGLLETHDVDGSLKEKLKCLIFIPVISRTYCDPRSFAWEHEFKTFIEQASKDQFGLKVRLPGGNVANRVLPVRIHDLDIADTKLYESFLGSVLRGIEFIYKSPGVNRPLRAEEENPNDNLNKTFYRNQINKVALAIKEIFSGLLNEPVGQGTDIPEHSELSGVTGYRKRDTGKEKKDRRKKLLSAAVIIAIIISAGLFIYPRLFRKNTLEKLKSSDNKISVVVMPFQNMTSDTSWNIWQAGIQNEMIASLTSLEELKVRQTETVNSLLRSRGVTNYAMIAPSFASTVSQNLNANVLVSGSINQAGSTIRLNAQLSNSNTEEVFKSFQINSSSEEILYAIDSLSSMVRDYLVISKLVKDLPEYLRYHPATTSPEAYKCYLLGENARSKRDFPTAIKLFSQALAIDSNFIHMNLMLSAACVNQGLYKEAKEWGDKAYKKKDQMPVLMRILTESNHALFYETPMEEIRYLRQFLEIDDQFPGTYYDIGLDYSNLYQYEKAIPEFEKCLEIYDKLDVKPWWVYHYTELGNAYHMAKQYKKEKKLYKSADKDFPNEPGLVWRMAILSLTEKDSVTANRYIDQYRSIYRANSWSEAAFERNMGWAYNQAGMPDKAEESFRNAIRIEPEEAFWKYYLASFLISNDRNIDEGMELIDKALKMRPEFEWLFLDTKGWGLYKQGKYAESLTLLEKCKSLSYTYSHEVQLHIDTVKKAITGQQNTSQL